MHACMTEMVSLNFDISSAAKFDYFGKAKIKKCVCRSLLPAGGMHVEGPTGTRARQPWLSAVRLRCERGWPKTPLELLEVNIYRKEWCKVGRTPQGVHDTLHVTLHWLVDPECLLRVAQGLSCLHSALHAHCLLGGEPDE